VGTLPADPDRTGYTFEGWFTAQNDGGTQFTAATAVAANITVYAKWAQANPFLGGIWLDWDSVLNYKFTEVSGTNIYSTAVITTFNVAGTYTYNTDAKEITLRPDGGAPIIKTYEITGSLLLLEKGKAGEAWLTKNSETGGGFNGDPAPAPLGGMWQNTDPAYPDDCLGFNNDDEYFLRDVQKNGEGKYWWSVVGSYEYDAGQKELILRHNGIDGQIKTSVYTVEFTAAGLKIIKKYLTQQSFFWRH
jgi:uncharacterized repeat protein (TIGR02543 family)